MSKTPDEVLADTQERFRQLMEQWGSPAEYPDVEWIDVEKARREVVTALKHREKVGG